MATRGGAAAKAMGAKRALVKLLFGRNEALPNCLTDTAPSPMLSQPPQTNFFKTEQNSDDPSHYSYTDLRTAYLERIKDLHPDLNRDPKSIPTTVGTTRTHEKSDRDEFLELQEAWVDYENIAKRMKRTENGNAEADFTLFGVGCSFSDNEYERSFRGEIMDQASRGWFAAGQIATGNEEEGENIEELHKKKRQNTEDDASSLLTMDEFSPRSIENTTTEQRKKPESLISHLLPPHKRRS